MPPVPVQTALAERRDVPIDLRAVGNVEPIAAINIKAQVTGELIDVSFKEGQLVKKGDLLFTIQPRLYATQLAQAEANLARDRAQAAVAKRELARQEELSKKGVSSREEFERARAQSESLEATVRADEALVLIAQTQLGYTTIESPIAGRTGSIRARPGDLIRNTSDQPLTTVVQMTPIYVAFSVPEQYLGELRRNMAERKLAVTARHPQNSKEIARGDVAFIENTVDPTTGTILVRGIFENTDSALWPGAFVDVILHLDTEEGMTVVPAPAVSVGQRGPQVYVIKEDGTADLRAVKTGRTVAQTTVIYEGVQPGEKVVTNGQSRLLPGAKVIDRSAGAAAGQKPVAPGATEKAAPTDAAKPAGTSTQPPKPGNA